MKRPNSLNDGGQRIHEMLVIVLQTESTHEIAKITNLSHATIRRLASRGVRHTPDMRTLIALDDLSNKNLLTPPERQYAEWKWQRTQTRGR